MPNANSRRAEIEAIEALMASIHEAITAAAPPEPWLGIDISMAQLKALCVIHHLGEARVGSVAKAVGLSLNATTAVLDRLEQEGLATRRPDSSDRRAVLVGVTAAGEALMQQLLAASTQMLTPYLRLISDADMDALRRGLSALFHVIQEADTAPTAGSTAPQSGIRPRGQRRAVARRG